MNERPPINESLLKQRLIELQAAGDWAPQILPALERFIRTADDYDLFRVNPIHYANANSLTEADGIELFVHAAKVGLFEMDWLLICAYCPQVAGSFRELEQVHPRFQCEFCNAVNDVALDDYIQVAFTVASGIRDIVFRHPERLSVGDYYLRYNFSRDFKAPHGMTHAQLVAVLSRGFADIDAYQKQKFDFDVTAGRFELLAAAAALLPGNCGWNRLQAGRYRSGCDHEPSQCPLGSGLVLGQEDVRLSPISRHSSAPISTDFGFDGPTPTLGQRR
jgi:hypothetical protein